MKASLKLLLCCCLIGCALTASANAKAVKFEATIDSEKVAIGESAQLGLTFFDTQSMPAPDLGNLDGLEARYIGPSTMMTVVNGRMSSSITHRYSILPLRVGKFQLGPFSFDYKGDSYASNMVILEATEERAVKEQKAEPDDAESLDFGDRIYLTLAADRLSAYVNELIPITVKLYVNRLNVRDIQLPIFAQEGFSKVEFKEPAQYQEEVSGVVYDVLEFKTNIFGSKPGDFRLGPAKIKCNVMVKKRVRRTTDPFEELSQDSFFNDFFTRYERYPLELKSRDIQLIVSPLPEQGRPADFMGAVGDYQFIYSANPTMVKAGDPITLRMDINGRGNFNTVVIPKIENTEGFRVYDAQVKTEEGRKSFTQVLMPESTDIREIPKVTFSYFDPYAKEYKTISHGPLTIQVEKTKEEAPAQVIGPAPLAQVLAKEDEGGLARDIIYIKESAGRLRDINYQIYKSKLFLLIIILPLVFTLSLYVVEGRRNRLKRDTRYARRVAAFRIARTGVKDLRRELKPGNLKQFYEALFKALQDYLGNSLGISPAGLTYDMVQEILLARNAEQDILRKVRNIFETSDMARFAGTSVEEYKMKDDLKEFEEIIRYFERMRA